MAKVFETISNEDETAAAGAERGFRPAFFYFLACFLIINGFFAPLLGIIFFIVHSLVINDRVLSDIGSIFIFISIPSLLIGSHFLDKFDEHKREEP